MSCFCCETQQSAEMAAEIRALIVGARLFVWSDIYVCLFLYLVYLCIGVCILYSTVFIYMLVFVFSKSHVELSKVQRRDGGGDKKRVKLDNRVRLPWKDSSTAWMQTCWKYTLYLFSMNATFFEVQLNSMNASWKYFVHTLSALNVFTWKDNSTTWM